MALDTVRAALRPPAGRKCERDKSIAGIAWRADAVALRVPILMGTQYHVHTQEAPCPGC